MDRFEARRARAVSVICGRLLPGAVVAPQIIVVERLRGLRSTGITLDPVVSMAIASTGSPVMPAPQRLARRRDQRLHVVGVALRRVVGIVLLAVQRILGDARPNAAALAVDDRDADAQRAEIDACNDGHR